MVWVNLNRSILFIEPRITISQRALQSFGRPWRLIQIHKGLMYLQCKAICVSYRGRNVTFFPKWEREAEGHTHDFHSGGSAKLPSCPAAQSFEAWCPILSSWTAQLGCSNPTHWMWAVNKDTAGKSGVVTNEENNTWFVCPRSGTPPPQLWFRFHHESHDQSL